MAYDGIDWTRAPRLARWWAADADGAAHWYNEPNVGRDNDFWYAERVAAPNFGFAGNFRDSLTPRPDRAVRKRKVTPKAAQ